MEREHGHSAACCVCDCWVYSSLSSVCTRPSFNFAFLFISVVVMPLLTLIWTSCAIMRSAPMYASTSTCVRTVVSMPNVLGSATGATPLWVKTEISYQGSDMYCATQYETGLENKTFFRACFLQVLLSVLECRLTY